MTITKELELFTSGDIEALKKMRDDAFMGNNTILYIRCRTLIDALEVEDKCKSLVKDGTSVYGKEELQRRGLL